VDVSGILEIYAPCLPVPNITFEEEVPSEADFWDRVQRICQNHPFWFVKWMDGLPAMHTFLNIGAWPRNRWTKEITVYATRIFTGNGWRTRYIPVCLR
jgi:L-amino acid N-acyltransferase YncA